MGEHVGTVIDLNSVPARIAAMRVAIVAPGNVDVIGGAILVDGLRAFQFLQVEI